MTATQSRPQIPARPGPPSNGGASGNGPSRGPIIFVVAGVLVVLVLLVAGIMHIVNGNNDEAEHARQREETRSKAEAVLRARFHDTDPAVGPLKTMTVTWNGDNLVADWVQGDTAQKKCHAPVIVGSDGQSFGIAKFDPVPFSKQDGAPATCVATVGLQNGLPMGP